MSEIATTLAGRTIAVQLEVKRLGVRRRVSSAMVRVRDPRGDETDPDAIRVSKELIACEQYDSITSLDSAFRTKLMKLALPSMLRRGVYLIPIDFLDRVDGDVRAYQAKRAELVDEFVSTYDSTVRDAQQRLGPLFDPADYPPAEDVKRAFEVHVQYIAFDVPDSLRRLNASVFERESKKLQASMREAAEEVRMFLRKGLLDLVEHLTERLATDESGKPKILQERTVQNLSEWLSLFDGRNVTNDDDLAQVVAQCRSALTGVDVSTLRKDGRYRADLAGDLDQVKKSLSTMIVDRPSRKFAWDDAAAA